MRHYVVVAVDGSGGGRGAAHWAAERAVERGLALRMVTVVPPEPSQASSAAGNTGRGAPLTGPAEVLGGITSTYPDLEVTARTIAGRPVEVLPGMGRGAEVLVLGTRGAGGFDELRLGSVALAVAGRAPCPVALVPPPATTAGRRRDVVVGVDARHPDEGALDVAFEEAALRGARLRAVHAWDLPTLHRGTVFGVLEEDRAEWEDQEVQLLDDALRGRRQKYPEVAVLPDVRLFGAAEALVRASTDAELMVIGRGPRTAAYLGGVAHTAAYLGGVAHTVAHHIRCPLLLARRH
jgi:nucleotide-binding universal stress UspA family protein